MDHFRLRNAKAHDFTFLKHLHKVTLGKQIQEQWQWTEDDFDKNFGENFVPQAFRIIEILEGTDSKLDVGAISWKIKKNEIYLKNLLLLPKYQRRGLGSLLIKKLKEDALSHKKIFRLTVLKNNAAVIPFYEKHGMKKWKEDKLRYFFSYQNPL